MCLTIWITIPGKRNNKFKSPKTENPTISRLHKIYTCIIWNLEVRFSLNLSLFISLLVTNTCMQMHERCLKKRGRGEIWYIRDRPVPIPSEKEKKEERKLQLLGFLFQNRKFWDLFPCILQSTNLKRWQGEYTNSWAFTANFLQSPQCSYGALHA